MFIAPQHFQQQERYSQQYVHQYVGMTGSRELSGVSELEIESNYLKLGKIGIVHCSGIFADGTPFHSRSELLLDIPQGTVNKVIYLALPLSVEGENEYGEKPARKRYSISQSNLFDASDNDQSAVEATLAEPNLRLVLEDEELTGLATIAVAKVLERREGGEVVLDKSFIPDAIQLGASSLLKERLKELNLLAQSRAVNVSQRIGAGQQTKSDISLMREFMWLQTLNRWIPWLHLSHENPHTLVADLYMGLVTFSSELETFNLGVAQPPAPMEKVAMQQLFGDLFSQLRDKLSVVQSDNVMEFSWDANLFEKRRLLRVALPNLGQLESRRFVISVMSSVGSAALSQVFPSACTLSGLSLIADLVRNSQSGIKISPLPVAPNELKAQADVAYFEIETSHEYWLSMKHQREPLALHVDNRIPDVSIKLYALG
ncbi:type VI secretion system baseplate subunit TssK [Vibrio sp. SCSIO 43136]|nr:type VI secretion system baseplate subunit TssK [Vibrio sp. SCSIO 43136]